MPASAAPGALGIVLGWRSHTCDACSARRRKYVAGWRARWQAGGVPEMPALARALTTSGPYQLFARRVLLPWVLQGERPAGVGLEIGAGSGAMTAQLLATFPGLQMTATDYDPAMVAAARMTLAGFGGRASIERSRYQSAVPSPDRPPILPELPLISAPRLG